MSDDFTVGEAARVVGVEPSRIRNWQQHRHIDFGTKGITGRYRFSARDVRVIALMTRLIDHGIEPGAAAYQSATIVDRIGSWRKAPLVAVFSREPNVSPVLIPEDSLPQTDVVIVVPLGELFADLEAKAVK